MSYLEAIILGLVQGLGEFLPISSSAHLVVAPWIAQFEDPGLSFSVALHLGTLIAVLLFFAKDWLVIGSGSYRYIFQKKTAERESFWLLVYLILATIPAGIAGLLLDDWAETTFRHPLVAATTMALLGAILFAVDRKVKEKHDIKISFKIAMLIGMSQALALIPGVSRSGITITTALLLGLTRPSAARFSFLLSTPIILGACVLKYKYFIEIFNNPPAVVGIVVAAVSGFLSIKYLMKLVQTRSYAIFCYYRFVFAAVVFTLFLFRQF